MKKIRMLFLAVLLLTGCSTASSQTALIAPESDVDLYLAAREVATNMAAYDEQTMGQLQDVLIYDFDLNATVDDNLDKIAHPDEKTTESLEHLREAYNNVVQIAEMSDVVYDIYEGKTLPVMGKVIDNEATQQACLTDGESFRPVLNSYLLDDPASAVGTMLCVPSVRGSYLETRNYARIFNAMGYNVLTLEPRFNHVEEDNKTYFLMNLDCLRAVRYIKYHAEELKIDADKLIVIAGSKGNYAHVMTTKYFDLTPSEYAGLMNVSLNDYTDDEIDQIEANVAVQIWNYGNMYAIDEKGELTLDDMGLYSQENDAKGLQLPAMLFLGGTDDTMVTGEMPNVMNALIAFNANEDKLYELQWEVHEFSGVPHGSGAGTQYANVSAYWQEADAFIKSALISEKE